MESFFQGALNLNLLQYLFHRLRREEPQTIATAINFLNAELPSSRLTPRVARLLNHLMYNHILTNPPFTTTAGRDGWLRNGEIVRVQERPLFPPIWCNSGASPEVPQLVWVQPPIWLEEERGGQAHVCPLAAFAAAGVACYAAGAAGSHVVILTRHRAQCILNYHAVKHVAALVPVAGTVEVATSLGFQGRTADQVVLCLPLHRSLWNSFHLEPKALFNILGHTQKTLYLLRHAGFVDTTFPGREQVSQWLQWYEQGRVNV